MQYNYVNLFPPQEKINKNKKIIATFLGDINTEYTWNCKKVSQTLSLSRNYDFFPGYISHFFSELREKV